CIVELKDEITLTVKELDTEHQSYILTTSPKMIDKVFEYLTGLSDGYVTFDNNDIYAKIEGPVVIRRIAKCEMRNAKFLDSQSAIADTKPYFIGQKALLGRNPPRRSGRDSAAAPQSAIRNQQFAFTPYVGEPRKTAIYEEHLKLTRPQFIVPFAGWSMPLWYSRASEEHQTVRQNVGLFDVSHMGKLQFTGKYASRFLDLVTTNYVPKLKIGQSHYSYILGPDGHPLDDILLYKMAQDDYLMVVNAANMEKIKQWLDAVNSKQVIIDKDNPSAEVEGSVNIRNRGVDEPLINVALQGPNGLKLLLKMSKDTKALRQLKKSHFLWTEFQGMKAESQLSPDRSIGALVARTGYTGEDIAFEIFTSREDSRRFWNLLLEAGKEFGIKPCGLAARDSLRAEAGLPLYGHELNGEHLIMPTEAGYGSFIKRHKPFFIGRKSYLKLEKLSEAKSASGGAIARQIVRFKITTPGARAIKSSDAVFKDGAKTGLVTSCVLIPRGVQIGLALVERKYAKENMTLNILPTSRKAESQRSPDLSVGDEVLPMMDALVLPRFLRK
ncbi:MAG: hypothetical protein HY762_09115, partial [Planctomycetes bacterium]|nr:hypothetical protein [Planctomycetota bacterium]